MSTFLCLESFYRRRRENEATLDPLCGRRRSFLSFSSDYDGNNFYNPFLSVRRIFLGKTYIYFLPEVPNLICTAQFSHCFIYFINNMSFFVLILSSEQFASRHTKRLNVFNKSHNNIIERHVFL